MRRLLLAGALALSSPLASCATMSDVVAEKREGGGTARDYTVDPATAYSIAREVFRAEEVDTIEEHPEEWSMRASMGMTISTYGTLMGAWIEQVGPYRVRVTVVTKRKLATTLATGLTEETFHDRFRERLSALAARAIR